MLNSNQVYTLDIIYTKIDWFGVSLSRPLTKFPRLRKRLLQQSYFLLGSFVKWKNKGPPHFLGSNSIYLLGYPFIIPRIYRFTPMEWVLLDPCDQAEDPEEIEQVNLRRLFSQQFCGFRTLNFFQEIMRPLVY